MILCIFFDGEKYIPPPHNSKLQNLVTKPQGVWYMENIKQSKKNQELLNMKWLPGEW